MPKRLRIATFNVENLDNKSGQTPTLSERIALMRPQLLRLDADILCLQEVHGQQQGGLFQLLALDELLAGTPYAAYNRVSTLAPGGTQVLQERNLIVLTHLPILERFQHEPTNLPLYRKITAIPPEVTATEVPWDRPILHARIDLGSGQSLHVMNLHLKSKIPTNIPGQTEAGAGVPRWKSCAGWAEGSFLSSLKRVGQALQTRRVIDTLFDAEPNALVVVCGDLNADLDEVPVEAIRGDVENTNNPLLAGRVMVPCERTVPESSRFSLYHQGKGEMLDHLLVSRQLLGFYRNTEIHNELLHDESIVGATDQKFPESDHAPVVAEFSLPD